MGALDDFRARFGGGGGKGSSTTGNILQDFESHFNVARLNPKNSQKAGGLNRLTEEQLASFGYKPSDIEDWNDLPERKQKKLEDVLTQISSSNISPYLAPGYKIGSISERDKGNPGQMQDLSTRGGLQAGLRGGAGGVLEGVIRGGSDMFGFGGHTAGEYTPQYLRQHPEVDRSALRESPESNGKAYVDRMNTPYTIKEPLEAGLNVALMRGAPATRFFGAGSTIAGRTAGAALKGGLENTAFGVATDLLNDKGTIEGRTRPFDGSFGSRVEAALTNAPSNFAAGAALGSVIGQKKKTSPDDNLTNIFFADKELRSLVKQQNSLEGVLGVINDANISKEVKRDLTKKVNTLSDTLALPEAKVAAYGEGFTMNNADSAITSASKQIKNIEKKLSDMESGKVPTTPQDYLALKQHRDDVINAVQNRDLTPPKRTTAVAETAPTVIRTSNSVDIAPKPISMAEVLAPDYAASQTKAIRDASKSGLRDRLSELRRKFTSTQIDDIGILDKTIKGKGLAADRDIGKLIDRSRRSDIMATRFGEDSGLNQIIRDYGDKGTFDEASIFLRDKRAVELYNKTGKNIAGVDLAKAAKNVDMNAAKYADLSARVKEYNNQFLDVVSGYGLISKDAAAYLNKEYPDYVPFNRVMDEIEKSFGGGSNASLSKQGVVQSIKGSEREINNVFENMYENMGRAFKQGEINNSAKTLSSYSEIPGNPFGIRELKPTEIVGNKNTFSYLDNGVKRTFEIKPEFMDAVKGMGNVELGVLGKVFAPATRVLKASATGLNVVFGVRNIPKDQQFSFIVSKHPILGLKNFFRAMGDVVGVGDFAKELQKYGGGSIEADVFRKMGKTVKQVRAERNLGSNIAFKSVRPNQWLRTLENTIGKTEELTRTQNARAYFESAIKSGKSKDIAMREAADAYNKVSVDFLRAGSIGRQLNAAIPFYNPGIQGTRTFLSAMKERPVQTGTKLIASVYMPMAALTAYNIADPARREIWNDIAPYDKEGNLILILPGAKKEGNGYTGVIKMPVNPAFSAINGLIGKTIEGTAKTPDIAKAIVETLQPFPSEPRKLLGQLTPQLLKPSIEQAANHDFFTDSPIVSDSIKNKPLQEQKYDSTSGTAIQIGKLLGISPVRVEKFIKQNLAEVGNQGLNASDNVLAALGVIPKDQIGGRSIVGGLTGALTTARGGDRENTFYSTINDASGARSSAVDKVNRAVNDGDYNLAKQLAQDYNRELDNKLSSFNSRFKKDSELEDALKRAYINDSDRALKSRKKK